MTWPSCHKKKLAWGAGNMNMSSWEKNWLQAGWCELDVISEGQGNGKDSPQMHKSLWGWLSPFDVEEGAFALFPSRMVCGM